MTYIHQLPDWPRFHWKTARISAPLAAVRHKQGRLLGHMDGLGFRLRQEATLTALTQDVLKTSEIEGEHLDLGQVRSSIARRLGIDIGALKAADRNVDGVVEMLLDATQNHQQPLTEDRLFGWQTSLFPGGFSGMHKIRAGAWRLGSMEVVSGPIGKERIHYEAPDASLLPRQMGSFLSWFNAADSLDPVLKSAIAHLWFVTIHPFDDGNGRVARALADLQLARSEGTSQRFYSMSSQIRAERASYYEILERTQKATLDITPWLLWYIDCLDRAIHAAHTELSSILNKSRFWETASSIPLNERQRLMLNRLLDGFEGKLTNAKWAKIAKTSSDTALRDIQYLVQKGLLIQGPEGGRSTSYELRPISL